MELTAEMIQQNKERFLALLRDKVQREGVDDLTGWLERSDFFAAPSSARFHGNYDGGLCEHSLNVYDCLLGVMERYPQYRYTDETAAIVALFHDLCKVRLYKKGFRNRKNDEGQWERYQTYEYDEAFPGGHGEKSAYIVQQFMKLEPEEYIAIRWHMGGWDSAARGGDRTISAAYDKYKLAPMLHLADLEASQLIEKTVEY